jgi:hypothetical protein
VAKREAEPIERFHVMLFSSDVEWFKEQFGSDGRTAYAIRHIIRAARRRIEELNVRKHNPLPRIENDEEFLNDLDRALDEEPTDGS